MCAWTCNDPTCERAITTVPRLPLGCDAMERFGFVGLPNAGKSSLYNALSGGSALAAPYAFATTEANVGMAKVPDPRLDALAALSNSRSVVPAAVQFVDIGGLVEGASKGEGLGNRFLAHPKISDVLIEPTEVSDPLTEGIAAFTTTDEIYVSELAADLRVLLDVEYTGPTPGFETDHGAGRHPVLFTRPEGDGQVTYFTLGHCRGRFDVMDLGIDDLGVVDRVAWESPEYREVLRRCVDWAVHAHHWQECPTRESA